MIGTLLELFWSCTKIGLLAFGGGNAAIPLLESEAVPRWISQQEFGDGHSICLPGSASLGRHGHLRAAWDARQPSSDSLPGLRSPSRHTASSYNTGTMACALRGRGHAVGCGSALASSAAHHARGLRWPAHVAGWRWRWALFVAYVMQLGLSCLHLGRGYWAADPLSTAYCNDAPVWRGGTHGFRLTVPDGIRFPPGCTSGV